MKTGLIYETGRILSRLFFEGIQSRRRDGADSPPHAAPVVKDLVDGVIHYELRLTDSGHFMAELKNLWN